jgi:hypothetical protein
VPALDGLRAPARFAVLVLLLLAMLAATGLVRLGRALGGRSSGWVAAVAIAACALEFWAFPTSLRHPPAGRTNLTRLLASFPADTVVLHLPVPRADRLWGRETTYQYLSIFHWRPLVNGYSGYAPPVYVRTLDALRTFPDEESIARLRRLDVGLVVVHPKLFDESEYERMTAAMDRASAFERVATLNDPDLESAVFRLTPGGAGPRAREDR